MPNSSHCTYDWVMSHRLYEVHIFYYILIITFWVIVGGLSLGFEMDGFGLQANLFFNFIWYLVLCLLMVINLIFFYHAYEVHKYQRYLAALEQEIEEKLTDDEKEIVWDLIQEQGHTLPTNKQRYALVVCWMLCFV